MGESADSGAYGRRQTIERLKAMKASRRRMGLGMTVFALFIAVPALAQENIDQGKTPAELYAADCAICHKTPHGLSKAGGLWGLRNFLREHYTASKESAAAIAAYLASIDRGAPAHARAAKRRHKNEKAKAKEEKSKKTGDAKLGGKPGGKPAGKPAKSAKDKSAKDKPEEAKLPPAKLPEAKAKAEAKSGAKSEAKSETKSETKPKAEAPASKPAPKHEPVEAKADAKTDAKTNGSKAPDAKPEKKTD
jgi:hypothetical protein